VHIAAIRSEVHSESSKAADMLAALPSWSTPVAEVPLDFQCQMRAGIALVLLGRESEPSFHDP
jgi:hypothetical protein